MSGKDSDTSQTAPHASPGTLAARMMAWIGLSMKQTRNMEGLQVLSEFGMTVPQTVALHLCAFESDVTMSMLVDRLALSPSAVSSMVQRLVELGFVTRSEDERDRRQKLVQVTENGRAFIERMMAARYEDMRLAFEPLSEETRALLSLALERMIREIAPEHDFSSSGTDLRCPTSVRHGSTEPQGLPVTTASATTQPEGTTAPEKTAPEQTAPAKKGDT